MVTKDGIEEVITAIDDLAYHRSSKYSTADDVEESKCKLRDVLTRLFVEKEDHG